MNNATLAIRDLSFAYQGVPVIKGLNLTFEPGKLHLIIGPNGSGKSTLLTIIAGHAAPTTGYITINDTPPAEHNASDLARLLALVPQEFDFKFPFTVFDAVLMGRHPHIPRFSRPTEEDMNITHNALNTMDIAPLANRPLSHLSGGEKQRTVVARALAQTTPCLLLDEPTSSMDIRHALTTLSELRRLAHTEGRTIIAVLHDLNLAAAFGDTVTILRDGQEFAHGTPDETLTPATIQDVFGVTASVSTDSDTQRPVITYDSKEHI